MHVVATIPSPSVVPPPLKIEPPPPVVVPPKPKPKPIPIPIEGISTQRKAAYIVGGFGLAGLTGATLGCAESGHPSPQVSLRTDLPESFGGAGCCNRLVSASARAWRVGAGINPRLLLDAQLELAAREHAPEHRASLD